MQMTVCGGLFSFSFSGNPGALLPVPLSHRLPIVPALGTAGDGGPREQGGPSSPDAPSAHTRRPRGPLRPLQGEPRPPPPARSAPRAGSHRFPPPFPRALPPDLPRAEGPRRRASLAETEVPNRPPPGPPSPGQGSGHECLRSACLCLKCPKDSLPLTEGLSRDLLAFAISRGRESSASENPGSVGLSGPSPRGLEACWPLRRASRSSRGNSVSGRPQGHRGSTPATHHGAPRPRAAGRPGRGEPPLLSRPHAGSGPTEPLSSAHPPGLPGAARSLPSPEPTPRATWGPRPDWLSLPAALRGARAGPVPPGKRRGKGRRREGPRRAPAGGGGRTADRGAGREGRPAGGDLPPSAWLGTGLSIATACARARARLCAGECAAGPPRPAWGDLRTPGAGDRESSPGQEGRPFLRCWGLRAVRGRRARHGASRGDRGGQGGRAQAPRSAVGAPGRPALAVGPPALLTGPWDLAGVSAVGASARRPSAVPPGARRAGPGPGGRCGRASLPGWPGVRQAHLGLARGQRGSRGRGPRRFGERPACSPALEGNLRELPICGDAPRGSGSPRGARPRRHPPRRPAARCTPLSLSVPSIARNHNRV